MHEILKEYNEKLNLIKLSCTEGCKITSWDEGDAIEDYSSFAIAYCPTNADTSIYHCISIEEDEKMMELQKELIENNERR